MGLRPGTGYPGLDSRNQNSSAKLLPQHRLGSPAELPCPPVCTGPCPTLPSPSGGHPRAPSWKQPPLQGPSACFSSVPYTGHRLAQSWPGGLTSSFFFLGLLSSPLSSESESALRLPPSDLSVSCAVFCDCRNSAMRSGQSRFSSGSHVLSSLQAEDTGVTRPLGGQRWCVHMCVRV